MSVKSTSGVSLFVSRATPFATQVPVADGTPCEEFLNSYVPIRLALILVLALWPNVYLISASVISCKPAKSSVAPLPDTLFIATDLTVLGAVIAFLFHIEYLRPGPARVVSVNRFSKNTE